MMRDNDGERRPIMRVGQEDADTARLNRRIKILGWSAAGTSVAALIVFTVFAISIGIGLLATGPVFGVAVALALVAVILVGAYIFAKLFYSTRVNPVLLVNDAPEDHQHAVEGKERDHDQRAQLTAAQELAQAFQAEEFAVVPQRQAPRFASSSVAPAPDAAPQQARVAALEASKLNPALAAHENLRAIIGRVLDISDQLARQGNSAELQVRALAAIKELRHMLQGKDGRPQIPEDQTGCRKSLEAIMQALQKLLQSPTTATGIVAQLSPGQLLVEEILTVVIASNLAQAKQLVRICEGEVLSQGITACHASAEACYQILPENSHLLNSAYAAVVALGAIAKQLNSQEGPITDDQLRALNQAGAALYSPLASQQGVSGEQHTSTTGTTGTTGASSTAIHSFGASNAFMKDQANGSTYLQQGDELTGTAQPKEHTDALHADVLLEFQL